MWHIEITIISAAIMENIFFFYFFDLNTKCSLWEQWNVINLVLEGVLQV